MDRGDQNTRWRVVLESIADEDVPAHAPTLPADATNASASVTITTANPVEVVARVILSSGGQFDSAAVVV